MWRAACRFRPTASPRAPKPRAPRFRSTRSTYGGNRNHFDNLQARYFASEVSSTPANHQSSNLNRRQHQRKITLKERTEHVMSTTERWSEHEWNSAVKALNSWAHHPKKKPDSLLPAFQILERMVREAEKNSRFSLTTDHLNQALNRWKILCTHPKFYKFEWSPENVLAMMDKLTSRVPSISLDTKSYALLMGGSIQLNPSEAYKFCNELVGRMENSSSAVPPNTVVFNYLMEAHVHSNQTDGASAALSIFDKIIKDPNLASDEKTLTRAFQALLMMSDDMTVMKAIPYIQRALNHVLESSADPKLALPDSSFLSLVLEHCHRRIPPWRMKPPAVPLADALMTVVLEKSKFYPWLEPDAAAYRSIIHLWATSLPDGAKNADDWLEKMVQAKDLETDPSKVDEDFESRANCYIAVIKCWGRSGNPDAAKRMGALLGQMMDESDRVAETKSEPVDYTLVAQTWARSSLQAPWSREEDVVEFMLRRIEPGMRYKMEGHRGRIGKLPLLTGVVRDFVKSGNVDKAVTLLERAAYDYPGVYGDRETGTELCHKVVNSIIGDSGARRIEFAKELLKRVTTNYVDGSALVKPSSKSFGVVMLEASNEGADVLVGELWTTLQDLQGTSDQDPDFMPDADVLTALCKTSTGWVARGDSVLHRMLAGARATNESSPSEALIDFVLDSLANSGDPTAGKRAETILLKIQELYEEDILPKPTYKTFQKVIDCWVACDEDGFAERAEEILGLAESLAEAGDSLMQPSCDGYTSVMSAWGKSHAPDAPERIQRLVRRMKQKSEEGKINFKPSEEAYNALLSAYANSGREDAGRMAQTVFDGAPAELKGTRLFNSLIAAQGGDSNRAEAILHEMHKAFLNGDTSCKPDTESFNSVLLAWSRSGSPMAAWRADGIFQRMADLNKKGDLDVRPDGTTFDIVITIISNEWGADAATKVDHYLELLKKYYSSGEPGCIPGVVSYTEAIRAWGSNVDDPRAVLRAKALLDEMHELARAGASAVKPDRTTYLVYLQALSQSSRDDKEDLARDALLAMKQNNIVLDQDLIALWQRCSLPMGGMAAYWTILQDDTFEFPSSMMPTKDETVQALP
jgi:hypothetical protein